MVHQGQAHGLGRVLRQEAGLRTGPQQHMYFLPASLSNGGLEPPFQNTDFIVDALELPSYSTDVQKKH